MRTLTLTAGLFEALEEMVYETTHLSPMEPNGDHWCRISAQALANARAALSKANPQITPPTGQAI